MTTVRLDAVSKTYGGDGAALQPTDLEIATGEFFTLLGPSGCGKTTTLRIVAGFETPTTGMVSFDGRDVTSLRPERRELGMVFQSYALFPHLDVAGNVAYGLRSRGVSSSDRERRVRESLASVGLADLAGRAVGELSGGQQQRVALARALVVSPRVLLLDEPLSNLDARLRDDTRSQVRHLQRDAGITTLYVTHDQAEALAVSDRVAVLEGGLIHQVGTPWEVYHRPRTRFVASFIGRANLVDGEIVQRSGDDATVRVSGAIIPATIAGGVTGGEVTLAIRPERIRVEPAAEGLVRGVVTDVEFLGSHSLLSIDLPGAGVAGSLRATVPEDGVSAHRHRVGDEVGLDLRHAEAWAVAR